MDQNGKPQTPNRSEWAGAGHEGTTGREPELGREGHWVSPGPAGHHFQQEVTQEKALQGQEEESVLLPYPHRTLCCLRRNVGQGYDRPHQQGKEE